MGDGTVFNYNPKTMKEYIAIFEFNGERQYLEFTSFKFSRKPNI